LIKELQKQRLKHKQSCINNNDNSHEIISHLYSETSHFIYELLQNAEDSEATTIEFNLEDEYLSILHNGKLFNYDDVNSITTIGFSTKKDDLNKIGKFGAGFKSVFAITKTPQIHSGDLNFEISDYIVPNEINKIELQDGYTKIILPFNLDKIDKLKLYQIISEKLENLEFESLLFLKNIKSINWKFKDNSGQYNKTIKKAENCNYIDITIKINDNFNTKNYIKIDKNLELNGKNLTLSIAYGMKDNKIIPIENSMLSVFFPTKIEIHYKFLLQAPYKTTPNRENIPFEDEENEVITAQLSKLVNESFLVLKNEKLLTIEFLESMLLEVRYIHSKLLMSIYEEIKKSFQTNKLLPTSCGKFAKSTDIILVQNNDLLEFIKNDDILIITNKQYLFCKHYSNNFTGFLNRILGIRVFNNDDIFNKIDIDFIKAKDDNWLISFYTLLIKQNFNKHYLSTKQLIKLSNNNFISLYKNSEEEKVQVYLPSEQSTKFKVLNKIFIENNILEDFIDKYKIIKPNNVAELKEFIFPKYINTPTVEHNEYIEDFNRIIEIYNLSNNNDKSQIISLCKSKFIILSCNSKFYQPEYIYQVTKELKNWFNKSQDINFIDNSINIDEAQSFLIDININLVPKLLSTKPYIHGLKSNLDNISFDDSLMIWNYLIKYLQLYYIIKDDKNIKYSSDTITYLKSILNSSKWLKSKINDDFKKPSEIILQDLDSRYIYTQEIKKYLIIDIEFKLDKIKQIEEELNCVFVEKDEFNEFKKWKEEKDNKNKDIEIVENIWKSNIEANLINNIQVKSYKKSKYRQDLSYQSKETYLNNNNSNSICKDEDSFETKKAIGDWGENFVNNYLTKKYIDKNNIEVKWLNQDSYLGIGYDFTILENNVEIEYIEVKSKLSYNPSSISITGTQWEWARDLYNNDNGNKYKIYIVLGAGNDDAIINIISNPIKQWKDGDLKAHPVNIEL
jgi:hypothetical protein